MHRAESVLQNCVMGRCAICIFMYCYISLFTMKKFGTRFEKLEYWQSFITYIRFELCGEPNGSAWVALLHSVGKKISKKFYK